jgi:hypothetical protein
MTNLLDYESKTVSAVLLQKSTPRVTSEIGCSLLLLGGLLSISCGFLGSGFSLGSHVQIELGVLDTDWLDEALLVEILDEGSGDGTTNLELLAKDGSSDAENLWDFLDHSLVLLVLEEDSVVKLFLDLNLGP